MERSETKKHRAAWSLGTGNLTAWNPDANNEVHTLAVSGTTVYVGGDFTIIGGQSRDHLAILDATTGAVRE